MARCPQARSDRCANYNYRLWAAGAIVSNVGTWMQRIAQDWLVLTQLTHNNATAVGVVMALQFGAADAAAAAAPASRPITSTGASC